MLQLGLPFVPLPAEEGKMARGGPWWMWTTDLHASGRHVSCYRTFHPPSGGGNPQRQNNVLTDAVRRGSVALEILPLFLDFSTEKWNQPRSGSYLPSELPPQSSFMLHWLQTTGYLFKLFFFYHLVTGSAFPDHETFCKCILTYISYL